MVALDFTIRPLIFPEEYGAVMDLWARAGTGIQIRPSDEPEEMFKKLQRDPDLFLVAVHQGEIIGTVLGGFDGRRGMVYHLAVSQAYRRFGAARALMQELEARLKKRGCIKYYLLVTPDNHEALKFYENFGCSIMDLRVLGKDLE